MFGIFFLLLFLRRGDQFVSPQLWVEDGTIIGSFAENGWVSFFHPVQGYSILASRLISFLAIKISFFHFPAVSTYLCWLFTIGVVMTLSSAPTSLKGGVWLGVFTLLIPSDPEAFGIPLYSFWWSVLLLFLVAFWNPSSADWKSRLAFVVLGGLSSPIILMMLPLLWLRALFVCRREWKLAVAGSLCAGLQAWCLAWSPLEIRPEPIDVNALYLIVQRFLGNYLVDNLIVSERANFILGVASLAAIVFFTLRHRKDPTTLMLGYLWLGTVAMSVCRVPVRFLDPSGAGPRYFFYPFIIESWFLVHTAFKERTTRWWILPGVMLLLSAINAVPVLSRHHDALPWGRHLASSLEFEKYFFPSHAAGNRLETYRFIITKDQSRNLLAGSLIGPSNIGLATYPVTTFCPGGPFTENIELVELASDHHVETRDAIGHFVVNQAYSTRETGKYFVYEPTHSPASDDWRGEIEIRLKKGDQILFKGSYKDSVQLLVTQSGDLRADFHDVMDPSLHWRVMEFSNQKLPEEFQVTFKKTDAAPGEWFAIALLRK